MNETAERRSREEVFDMLEPVRKWRRDYMEPELQRAIQSQDWHRAADKQAEIRGFNEALQIAFEALLRDLC